MIEGSANVREREGEGVLRELMVYMSITVRRDTKRLYDYNNPYAFEIGLHIAS